MRDNIELALATQRALKAKNPTHIAESLAMLAYFDLQTRRFQAAEAAMDEALTLHTKDDDLRMVLLTRLGQAKAGLGKHKEAIVLYDQAKAMTMDLGKSQEVRHLLANTESARAESRFALGEPKRAEAILREAIAYKKQVYGDRHPSLADAYLRLGQVILHRSATKALPWIQQSLDLREAAYGASHFQTAKAQVALTECLLKLDEKAAASEQLEALRQQADKPYFTAIKPDVSRLEEAFQAAAATSVRAGL